MHTEGVAPGEMAKVLGVGRATVYRHLDAGPRKDTPIEDRASDPPVSVVQQGGRPAGLVADDEHPGAQPARRANSRTSCVIRVEAGRAQRPGAGSGAERQTSPGAAKAALVKALGRRATREPGAVLEVRGAEQIVTRLDWDAETRTCVVRAGPLVA